MASKIGVGHDYTNRPYRRKAGEGHAQDKSPAVIGRRQVLQLG
jgi:hypothetical protein